MSGPDAAFVVPPGDMSEAEFMTAFGEVYEASPWVARIVWWEAPHASLATVNGLCAAMSEVVDRAPRDIQLALLRSHPDLAGRAARAGDLSTASTREQEGAGLDQCSKDEYAEFHRLNDAYKAKFAFPFIVAVGGLNRRQILELFRFRLENSPAGEFANCLAEVHKIARLRVESVPTTEGEV